MKRRFSEPEATVVPRTVRVFHPGDTGADTGPGTIAPLTPAQLGELAQAVVEDHAVFPSPPFVGVGRYSPGSEMSRVLGLYRCRK